MNNDDALHDKLCFAEESEPVTDNTGKPGWKILIADDEEEIHHVTLMALQGLIFEERKMVFLHAYSGEEAIDLVGQHPDIAVILLDVVMESDHAGLEVARQVRENLDNSMIRIILRTGRSGQAPERRVILDYDINDYKEKTELTVQKLTTAVITALRSYRDLTIIDRSRKGLLKVIKASAKLFEIQSLRNFAQGVLIQLLSILNINESSMYFCEIGFPAPQKKDEFMLLAATGAYEAFVNQSARQFLPQSILGRLLQAINAGESLFFADAYVGYFPGEGDRAGILYLDGKIDKLVEMDRDLIRLFSTNVAIAFKNLNLNQEIIDTQKEVICTLGEVVEKHSQETANHVKRVAEVSWLLAIKAGLSEEQADILRLASPMHDIGKVGVPEALLTMPDKLTAEQFELIKAHSSIGYSILKKSNREIMKAAAIIAHSHHERWDGTGYPNGFAGEEIHIFARITGLADVFDALSHRRVYKAPWPPQKIYDLILEERGRHFDPKLTDLFLEHFDEIISINKQFPSE